MLDTQAIAVSDGEYKLNVFIIFFRFFFHHEPLNNQEQNNIKLHYTPFKETLKYLFL